MRKLTKKQAELLDFLIDYVEQHLCPPSTRRMMAHFGWASTNAIQHHLSALRNKGFVELAKGKARALRVLRRPDGSTFQLNREALERWCPVTELPKRLMICGEKYFRAPLILRREEDS